MSLATIARQLVEPANPADLYRGAEVSWVEDCLADLRQALT